MAWQRHSSRGGNGIFSLAGLLMFVLQLQSCAGFQSAPVTATRSSSTSNGPVSRQTYGESRLLRLASLPTDGNTNSDEAISQSRRSVMTQSRNALLLLSQWSAILAANAGAAGAAESTAATMADPPTTTSSSVKLPKITNKIQMDVRISRPDGTFSVRDDETDNLVKKYSLVIGLFGTAAPTHVERFLSYLRTSEDMLKDDKPFPSYAQSQFKSFDQATGVLVGGTIPSLAVTEFAGSTALQFGGRIMGAPLWLEKRSSTDGSEAATEETLPLAHSAKGLLIHRKLEVQPVFGITTRSDTGSYISDLDRDNVVFGTIMEGMDFLTYCAELQTYLGERPVNDNENAAVQDATKAVFDAQRDFFRGAAKSLGDSRVAKVYPGRLLRRVEVTKVSIL